MPSDSVLPSAPPAGPGTQESLYRAALGPVHAEHYLPAFARFDERGANGPAWNTAAAVGNLGWLVYRQLWGAAGEFAAALAVWALIAAGLAFWADVLPLGVRAGLALSLLLLLLLVPGLYGTALLHAQVRRRMIAAVQQAATMDEACTLLRWQGDAHRRRGGWGVAGLLLVAALASWVWMAWPASYASSSAASVPVPVVDFASAAVPPVAALALAEPQVEAQPAPAVAASAEPPSMTEVAATTAEKPEVPRAPTVPLVGAAPPPPAAAVAVRVRGYGVSVGLFAVPENAERAQAKLVEAGLPVSSDPIESARGLLTRVRVGPFKRREQAQAAAERVRALGLDARVYAP